MSHQATTVYIGRKPVMNYVLAVLTGFHSGAEEVTLKARGRAITYAVDTAEVARRRFLDGVTVSKIEVGSEEILIKEEQRTRTVSTIEIILTRAKQKPKKSPQKTGEPPKK